MSTLQFPKNPAINDEYDWEGFKYVYDGQKWKTIGVGYNPVNDLKDKLEPRIDELEDGVNSLNVRVTAEEKDTKDWEGFTAELLAQGGVPDNGQPDELGNSKRVGAIIKISGRKFASVADMIALSGKLSAGDVCSTGLTQWRFNGGISGTILDFNPLSPVSVTDFGAVGDGVTDDTASIKQALLVPDISHIYFPKNNYMISESLVIPRSIKCFELSPDAVITQTAGVPALLKRGSSSEVGVVLVTGPITKGMTYITASGVSSTLSVGDFVYFRCNNLTPNVTAGSRVGVIRRIVSVDSGGFRVDKAIFREMSSSISVRKLDLTSGFTIKGGTIRHASPVDNKSPLVHFFLCIAPNIVGTKFIENGGTAILLQNTFGGSFADGEIRDLLDGSHTSSSGTVSNYHGYGIAFGGATRGFTCISGTVSRVRHAVTTLTLNPSSYDFLTASDKGVYELRGEPEGITVLGGFACYDTTEAALDTHEQGYDIVFTPNVSGCFKGVQIRATDVTVSSGFLAGSRRYSILIAGPASNAATTIKLNPNIFGTVISSTGEDGKDQGTESKGILVATNGSVVTITGVSVSGCRGEAIVAYSGNKLRVFSSNVSGIAGNVKTGTGIIVQGSGHIIDTVIIENCSTGLVTTAGQINEINSVYYSNNTINASQV